MGQSFWPTLFDKGSLAYLPAEAPGHRNPCKCWAGSICTGAHRAASAQAFQADVLLRRSSAAHQGKLVAWPLHYSHAFAGPHGTVLLGGNVLQSGARTCVQGVEGLLGDLMHAHHRTCWRSANLPLRTQTGARDGVCSRGRFPAGQDHQVHSSLKR